MSRGRISALWIHPVKGCSRVAIREAPVEPAGLANDRRWMVVDPEGTFISQRECRDLVHVQPERDGMLWRLRWKEESVSPALSAQGPETRVRIWRDTVDAVAATSEASEWLSAHLARSVRLVFVPEASLRPVNLDYGKPGDRVSFADGYPVLVASTSSLVDLNARLDEPVPMNRFRPNIVVDGFDAFAEDRWTAIRIGEVDFDAVKPCGRCQVINVDQESGQFDRSPLRTLATYRTVDGNTRFGINLIPRGNGVIRMGDPVRPSSK